MLLGHPNVKVFVTHSGLMGSSEAAYCGVPVVATPMFGDQFLNSAAFVNRGMGTIVHYEAITKEAILDAINFALSPTAQTNAKKVSYAYTNRIQTPVETAIWWVENVAATDGAQLTKSYSVFMCGIAYHSLDVIFVILLAIIVILTSWIWLVKKVCCGRTKSVENSKKKFKIK